MPFSVGLGCGDRYTAHAHEKTPEDSHDYFFKILQSSQTWKAKLFDSSGNAPTCSI
jgi:hypothetical protein